MLMVGAGALAPYLIEAHAKRQPDRRGAGMEPQSFARRSDRRAALRSRLLSACDHGSRVRRARGDDVISCATLFARAAGAGAWLRPGAHLDLVVGAFTPKMRESDDEAVRRATVPRRHALRGSAHGSGRYRAAARCRSDCRAASPATFSTSAVEEQRAGEQRTRSPVQIRQDSARGTWPPPLSPFATEGNLGLICRRNLAAGAWRSSAAISAWFSSTTWPNACSWSSRSAGIDDLLLSPSRKRAEGLDHAIRHLGPLVAIHFSKRAIGLMVEESLAM